MSRTLSTAMRQAMFDEETTEEVIAFLTLDREGWAAPVYLVNYAENLERDGKTFVAYGFDIQLPEDSDGTGVPILEIVGDNVARELVDELRANTLPIRATIEVALVSAFETPEITYSGECYFAEASEREIRTTMTVEPILDESFSRLTITPETAPGAFRSGRGLSLL